MRMSAVAPTACWPGVPCRPKAGALFQAPALLYLAHPEPANSLHTVLCSVRR